MRTTTTTKKKKEKEKRKGHIGKTNQHVNVVSQNETKKRFLIEKLL